MDIDADTGQPVLNRPWAPPKTWSAWPLRVALVPPDDFMKRTEDEDEAFTFRRLEREAPSSKLEEIVSAAILRCAKDKFRMRSFDEAPKPSQKPSQEDLGIKREPVSSGNEPWPDQADSEDEKIGLDAVSAATPKQKKGGPPQRSYKPAVATDDDASYQVIRPSARSILEKLDQTLTILHNARMTSAQNLVDAANASSSGDESLYDEATPGRNSRSRATSRASFNTARARSRSTSQEVRESARGETPANPATPKSNRGRKAHSKPRHGETEREFLIRRAKEQKKKRPVFSDADGGDANTAVGAAKDDAKSPTPRRGRRRRASRTGKGSNYWAQKRLERLNLRDWSDVMGAAALAGFSPRVVERATQRCADLFGEGMDMHTIAEATASSGGAGINTKRYLPGGEISSSESDADNEDGDLDLRQARALNRMSSAAPSRTASRDASPNLSTEDEHGRDSPRKRQKRSVSRGSAVGSHYCPHVDCERAYRGFERPFNLNRHLKLVHNEEVPSEGNTKGVATEDLLGGVHRDGFLEPIRIQRGWRAKDVKKRARKRSPLKRPRDKNSEEEGSELEGSSTESPSGSEGDE